MEKTINPYNISLDDWSTTELDILYKYADENPVDAGEIAKRRLNWLLDTESDNYLLRGRGYDNALQHLLIYMSSLFSGNKILDLENPPMMVLGTLHLSDLKKEYMQEVFKEEIMGELLIKPCRYGPSACLTHVSRISIPKKRVPEIRRLGLSGQVLLSGKLCAVDLASSKQSCPAYVDIKPTKLKENVAAQASLSIPLFDPILPPGIEKLDVYPDINEDENKTSCLCAWSKPCPDSAKLATPVIKPIGVLSLVFNEPIFHTSQKDTKTKVESIYESLKEPLMILQRIFRRWQLKRPGRKAIRAQNRSIYLLNNSVGPGESLQMALAALSSAFPNYNFSFHKPIPGTDSLQLSAIAGKLGRSFLLLTEYPKGHGVVGRLFEDDEPSLEWKENEEKKKNQKSEGAPNETKMEVQKGWTDKHHILFPGTRRNIAFKAYWHKEVMGILNVETHKEEIEEGDLDKLKLAADCLGLLVRHFDTRSLGRGEKGNDTNTIEEKKRHQLDLIHYTNAWRSISRFIQDSELFSKLQLKEVKEKEVKAESQPDIQSDEDLDILQRLLKATIESQPRYEGWVIWGSISKVILGKTDTDNELRVVCKVGAKWEEDISWNIEEESLNSTTCHVAKYAKPVRGFIHKIDGKQFLINQNGNERDGDYRIGYHEMNKELKSEIVTPIIFGKNLLGTLEAGSNNRNTYDEHITQLLYEEYAQIAGLYMAYKAAKPQIEDSTTDFRNFLAMILSFVGNVPLQVDAMTRMLLHILQDTISIKWFVLKKFAAVSGNLAAVSDETQWWSNIHRFPIKNEFDSKPESERLRQKREKIESDLLEKVLDSWSKGKKSVSEDTKLAIPIVIDGRLIGSLLMETYTSLKQDGRRELIESWASVVGRYVFKDEQKKISISPHDWLKDFNQDKKWLDIDHLLEHLSNSIDADGSGISGIIYKCYPNQGNRIAKVHTITGKLAEIISEKDREILEQHLFSSEEEENDLISIVLRKDEIVERPSMKHRIEEGGRPYFLNVPYFDPGSNKTIISYLGFPILNDSGEIMLVIELFRERVSTGDDLAFSLQEKEEIKLFSKSLQILLSNKMHLSDYRFVDEETLNQFCMMEKDNEDEKSRDRSKTPYCYRLIGVSKAQQEVNNYISKYAGLNFPILLVGEMGTGKREVAMACSAQSKYHKPFGEINAANLTDELNGSDLFGHKPGAYTGAGKERKGIIVENKGGTIHIDECHCLKKNIQTSMNTVLDKKEIKQVGSDTEKKIDVRFIFATNENTDNREHFNADFVSRINLCRIEIPPLRKRKSDIPLLINWFNLQYEKDGKQPVFEGKNGKQPVFEGITAEALYLLNLYHWPENVRELKNFTYSCHIHKGNSDSKMITEELVRKVFAIKQIDIAEEEENSLQAPISARQHWEQQEIEKGITIQYVETNSEESELRRKILAGWHARKKDSEVRINRKPYLDRLIQIMGDERKAYIYLLEKQNSLVWPTFESWLGKR